MLSERCIDVAFDATRAACVFTDIDLRFPQSTSSSLTHFTLTVASDDFMLLAGPTGAGKSTIAMLLAGLIPRSIFATVTGEFLLWGRRADEMVLADFASSIGLLFQDPDAQICTLTVADEIAFGCENRGIDPTEIALRVENEFLALHLDVGLDDPIETLSEGQKQLVMLASILASRPRLLILDEPLSNLDAEISRHVVDRVLEAHRSGVVVVVIDHRMDAWLPVAKRLVVVDRGSVVSDGVPWHVFTSKEADKLEELGICIPEIATLCRRLHGQDIVALPWSVPPLAQLARSITESGYKLRHTSGERRTFPPTPLVNAEKLQFAYGEQNVILDDVSFSLSAGEICAVVGPNGGGKTTLLKIAAGLILPTKGTMSIDAKSTTSCASPPALGVGFLFQRVDQQLLGMTVLEDITISTVAAGRYSSKQLMKMVNLEGFEDRHPWQLSTGQRHKVALCSVLPFASKLLVLDEPTMGLDRNGHRTLARILRNLAQEGLSILFSSHELQFVLETADSIMLVRKGRIAYQGASDTKRSIDTVAEGSSLCPSALLASALSDVSVGTLPVTADDVISYLS